jgi:hypothetical protein
LQYLENQYPNIFKLHDIGDSRGKQYAQNGLSVYDNYEHEIWAVKISDNVESEEDEPSVYYFGTHHAREPISLEVVMNLMNYLLESYENVDSITEYINNAQIWFVPLVNPDGHKIVMDEVDLWHRKNIADNNGNGILDFGDGWSTYPDGVDPNRNYAYQWGTNGASQFPEDQTYYGTAPFSEPETRAIRDLMSAHQFVAGISYHSYSELVLHPYGYAEGALAPDYEALADLAEDMAETIPAEIGGHYTPSAGWELYPASGITDDYAYGQHGIFGFTIELGTEFIPPANQVQGIADDNLQASLILLDRVFHSTLTGKILDAESGEAIVASIEITEIDNIGDGKEPYLSNASTGRYYRLLTEGSYTAVFSAYGYVKHIVENVMITEDGQTQLDIHLVPAASTSISGIVRDALTGESIDNANVQVLESNLPAATTNTSGEFAFDEIFVGDYTFRISHENYASNLANIQITENTDIVQIALYQNITESFEAMQIPANWTMQGDADWILNSAEAYDGNQSLKSDDLNDEEYAELSITVENVASSEISFYYKVSSEGGWDFLEFFIDNSLIDSWSGETDWEFASYIIGKGNHTFTWIYDKDYSVSDGSDCAWIDLVSLPASIPDAPILTVLTDSVNHESEVNTVDTLKFSIMNTGIDTLYYEIDITDEENNAWLSLPENTGAVYGNEPVDIQLIFNTNGLEAGEYSTDLIINESYFLPVKLVVLATGTNELFVQNQDEIAVYPNPFKNNLVVEMKLIEEAVVNIAMYDIAGNQIQQILANEKLMDGLHRLNFNISENAIPVKEGIYHLVIRINDQQTVKKVISIQ